MKNTRINFINGKWINEDLDLIPTIKIRRSSKLNESNTKKAVAFSVAICFLKWAIVLHSGKVIELKSE
jgi:hypothetical protein